MAQKWEVDHAAVVWIDKPSVRLTEHMNLRELVEEKLRAVAEFLNVEDDLVRLVDREGTTYECDDCQFLVCTEAEANEKFLEKCLEDNIDNSAELLEDHGRGYILATDGEENSESEFYIYRLN